jgi:hypothetical protein
MVQFFVHSTSGTVDCLARYRLCFAVGQKLKLKNSTPSLLSHRSQKSEINYFSIKCNLKYNEAYIRGSQIWPSSRNYLWAINYDISNCIIYDLKDLGERTFSVSQVMIMILWATQSGSVTQYFLWSMVFSAYVVSSTPPPQHPWLNNCGMLNNCNIGIISLWNRTARAAQIMFMLVHDI